MKIFSMPADFKTGTIDRYHELNQTYNHSKIIETYGQLTIGTIVGSGRTCKVIADVNYEKLEEYVRHSKKRGIQFNYTLNPSCMGNFEFSPHGIQKIKALLKNLYHIGIRWLTISLPPLIEIVKASDLPFKIKASAICEIASPDKALFYKKLGVDRIVTDADITRDFPKLKSIGDVFDSKVELIVNNICYKHCPYKMFHYNHESHATPANTGQTIHDYYDYRCAMQKAGKLENVIRLNWVRPEDLKYYLQTGINYFKIQGRQNVEEGDPVRTVEAYIKEDFHGSLLDLIMLFVPYSSFHTYIDNKKLEGFVKRFFDHPHFCTNMCSTCKYCLEYAKKSMKVEETEEINQRALSYLNETDTFKNLIKEPGKKSREKILQPGAANFDFEEIQ